MASAVNPDTGEVLVLDPSGEWTKAKTAQNPQTGERLYLDGAEWKPVPLPKTKAKTAGIDKEVRDLGLGARYSAQGLASIPGMFYDAGRAVMNTPTAIYNMVADKPKDYPFPTSSAQLVDKGLDAIGLPKPQTEGGGMMGAVVRGGASAIPTMGAGVAMQTARVAPELGAMLAAQPASQMGGSIGSSAAAEYANQKGQGPVVQGLASILGGVGGAGLVQGIQATGRGIAAASQPFTQAGREQIAASALLQQSADPMALRARIDQGVADQSRRLPGSPVTTAMAARDPGLMVLEQGLRSDVGRSAGQGGMSGSAAFRDFEAQRNASRLRALQGMGDDSTPDLRGATTRTALQQEERSAKDAVSSIYKAIDPDGTTAVPVSGIAKAMGSTANTLYGKGSGARPAELEKILSETADIAKAGGTVDFEWLQNIRSRLGNEAGKARSVGDNRAASAFSGMRESLDGAVDAAIKSGTGFTPEQQSIWSWATASRRDVGQRFGRNESGNALVGQILKRDQFGAPMMPDAAVTDRALGSVGSVKQVLSAAGPKAAEVSQQLRGAFVDKMLNATRTSGIVTDAAGNTSTALSPAGFDRFLQQNKAVAEQIFSKQQLGNIKLIASDFAETAMVNTTGRAKGSDTAQNMSVANFIGRASNGIVDPSAPGAQTAASLGGILRLVYAAPEAAIRELILEAARNPQSASILLNRATPANLQRASQYLNSTMMDRLITAATGAGVRQGVRTTVETADSER